MPQRTDRLPPQQLLEVILACDSRDEIHAIATGWLRANTPIESSGGEAADIGHCKGLGTLLHSMSREAGLTDAEADSMSDRNSVFLLGARPRTAPSSLDPLAVYSSREAAEAWVAIQEPALQEVLEIHRCRLDKHTDDDYWAKPGMESVSLDPAVESSERDNLGRAFHVLAGMTDDSDPRSTPDRLEESADDRGRAILTLATTVLGSEAAASDWMSRPQSGLNGGRPLELVATTTGAQMVEDLLRRMESGTYS